MLILYTQRRPVTDSGKEATSDNAELQELMFSERTFSPRDKRQKRDQRDKWDKREKRKERDEKNMIDIKAGTCEQS